MYFKTMPKIYYPFTINGNEQYLIVKDITVNIRFVKEFLGNITLYDLYDIREGETPEILSDKFYGTPFYHWILMIANDRYDYLADWPLTADRLTQYVQDKYGVEYMYSIHHYENAQGYVVDSSWPNARVVSNFDFEDRLNESKRTIKVIDKSLVEQIAAEFAAKVKV